MENRLSEIVTDYMARGRIHRDHIKKEGADLWCYPLDTAPDMHRDETQESLDYYAERLSLVVPGLQVTRSSLQKNSDSPFRGYIWFTWSIDAMWARIREVFEKYGVADERLDYMKCSGKLEGKQLRLPGFIEPESRHESLPGLYHGWTVHGLMKMDSGFSHRIKHPDLGGPEAIPFCSQCCVVGNEWWRVGSKGDSKEVLAQEIGASPLEERTKENLLCNLNNYRLD